MNNILNFIALPHAKGLEEPKPQTIGASGFDLSAAIVDDIILKPLQRYKVPTGFKVKLNSIDASIYQPELQIRPRSGLANKYGVTVLNTPGTIDKDYEGELFVLLINLSNDDFIIKRAMRIAQLIISFIYLPINTYYTQQPIFIKRKDKGFGSTGQ